MRMLAVVAVPLGLWLLDPAPLPAQIASKDRSTSASDSKTADALGVAFPELTGPYKVGRASYHLVDPSRKEIFTEMPDDVRELAVTVHYPAEVAAGQSAAPYADAQLAAALSQAYHVSRAVFDAMHSHAFDKPPAAAQASGFLVVLFSPGFKSHPLFYTAVIEELASHGFVVVSLCHSYSTGAVVFPDGQVLRANDQGTKFELHKTDDNIDHRTIEKERDAIGEVWLADVRFVLDSLVRLNKDDKLLAGSLDLSRVGVFGHSFGGATAAAAVERDPRFRAGINLDGSDFSGTNGDKIGDRFWWLASEPPDVSNFQSGVAQPGDQVTKPVPADGPAPSGPRVVVKRDGDRKGPVPERSKLLRPSNGLRRRRTPF